MAEKRQKAALWALLAAITATTVTLLVLRSLPPAPDVLYQDAATVRVYNAVRAREGVDGEPTTRPTTAPATRPRE